MVRATSDPAQVAEWAGHSVGVLLKVYAKCVHGAEADALQRVWEATRSEPQGSTRKDIGKNQEVEPRCTSDTTGYLESRPSYYRPLSESNFVLWQVLGSNQRRRCRRFYRPLRKPPLTWETPSFLDVLGSYRESAI